jgi:hypothetical protein
MRLDHWRLPLDIKGLLRLRNKDPISISMRWRGAWYVDSDGLYLAYQASLSHLVSQRLVIRGRHKSRGDFDSSRCCSEVLEIHPEGLIDKVLS